jgi:hypothetical protein
VSRRIVSFADLAEALGWISHNCVKYNGRESDYGLVAREFEHMVDETIWQAVQSFEMPTGEASEGQPGGAAANNSSANAATTARGVNAAINVASATAVTLPTGSASVTISSAAVASSQSGTQDAAAKKA